ncbi:DEAD/DEAH box helicase [Methylomonas rapida]|uniref:DEAD/DEAH box helicase n=1 Tax=Methylomonas rapida TaxID=2963939 RepID=A0ABY7GF42_9GAMM|nr:DEAD/DEAH box helicase [Methylomonas rapida]WAR43884.1 DEAD/DEAH box helicase [Methylomonas rapida]
MKITLTNHARIEASENILNQIEKRCTHSNPKYYEALRQNRYTGSIPKQIMLSRRMDDGSLVIPVGMVGELFTAGAEIMDNRRSVLAQIGFNGQLRDYQQTFVADAMRAKGGVLVAATGAGKTISAIALASRLEQRMLVLVKSKDLAEQWRGAIEQFTGLTAGMIGAGKDTEGEQFTVGTVQTLVKRDLSQLDYGLVIADECHNAPADQFYQVITGLDARYKYGLSATPQRRDSLEFMIHAALGPVVSEIKPEQIGDKVLPVEVEMVELPWERRAPETWQDYIDMIVSDAERNDEIIRQIDQAQFLRSGAVIVLSQQINHCEILAKLAEEEGLKPLLIHGQLPSKTRLERMSQAPDSQLIIGTTSLLSEGIDWPHLQTLIFATPLSAVIEKNGQPAATKLIQSIGRCRRPYPGKTCAYVIDFVDRCAFGYATAKKRRTIYEIQGFTVERLPW